MKQLNFKSPQLFQSNNPRSSLKSFTHNQILNSLSLLFMRLKLNVICLLAIISITAIPLTGYSATNLFTNPGFEQGSTDWTMDNSVVATDNKYAGSNSSKITGNGAGTYRWFTGLKANTTYKFSGYGLLSSSGNNVYLYVKQYGGAEVNKTFTSTGWQYQELIFTTGTSNTAAEIGIWQSIGGSTWIDDLTLVEATSNSVAVTGVTIVPTSISVAKGATSQLSATVAPSSATDQSVSWVSSNTAVATVSNIGLVSAIAVGTANVTVTTTDGSKTDVCAVTVTSATTSTNIALNKTATASSNQSANPPSSGNDGSTTTKYCAIDGSFPQWWQVDLGKWYTLTGTLINFEFANQAYKYKIEVSADGSNWTTAVDKTGNATNGDQTDNFTQSAMRYVKVTITAVSGGMWACFGEVQVFGKETSQAVTGLVLNQTAASIMVNNTSQLTATVVPSNANNQTITWSSSNTAVATVSNTGLVTAKALGSAVITATTADGQKTATCTVTVVQSLPVSNVALNKPAIAFTTNSGNPANLGNDGNLSTQYCASGGEFPQFWQVDLLSFYNLTGTTIDPEVSDVAYKYKVETSSDNVNWTLAADRTNNIGPGKQTDNFTASNIKYVRFRFTGNSSDKWACFKEVEVIGMLGTNVNVTSVSINPSTLSLGVGKNAQLYGIVTPSGATNKTIIWTSNNTAAATVNSDGIVTGISAGNAIITGTTMDGNKSATSAVSISASPSSQVLVNYNFDETYQTIEGWGGFGLRSVNWDYKENIYSDAWADKVFDMGLTITRHELFPEESDQEMSYAQIAPLYKQFSDRAKVKGVDLKWILCVWTPPYRFKTENRKNGGTLKADAGVAYGNWLVEMLKKYQANGQEPYGLSLQNEPNVYVGYNSCNYNGEQFHAMFKAAAPIVKAAFPNIRIIAPDEPPYRVFWYWGTSVERSLLFDEETNANVDIWAPHGYFGKEDGSSDNDEPLEKKYYSEYYRVTNLLGKNKSHWMTEQGNFNHDLDSWNSYAGSIYQGLKYENFNAWIFWYISTNGVNDMNLMYFDQPNKNYYVSAQYYRFIKTGAQRVAVSSTDDELKVLGFKHVANNQQTFVFVNNLSSASKSVKLSGSSTNTFTIYRTSATENCANVGTVEGNGTVVIPGYSIVTLSYNVPFSFSSARLDEASENSSLAAQNSFTPLLYPNPSATGHFNIDVNSNEDETVSFEVTDVAGKPILSEARNLKKGLNKEQLNLVTQPTGVYFLFIRQKEGMKVLRLEIE